MIRLPTHRPPTSPGEMLQEEFLKPLGLSARQLALAIHVAPNRISEIVRGRRALSADTALRLARYFGLSVDFWLNLQLAWDLWHAIHSDARSEIERIKPLKRAG